MEYSHDNNVFKWSIFLKESGECIGRISCHAASSENPYVIDPNIRGVGWIIELKYRIWNGSGKGDA